MADHRHRHRSAQVFTMSGVRVVGVAMGDDGFIHRFPRVDVDVCLRAVDAVGGELEHGEGLLVVGCWLLVVGDWLLAFGYWLLAPDSYRDGF